MNKSRIIDLSFYVFALLASIIYFGNLPLIPFHPDESTQIFMSSDFQILMDEPDDIYWSKFPDQPLKQKYRALDAPLSRTMIGIGRTLFGLSGLENDWNWSVSWQANAANGALPEKRLLIYSRVFVAFVLPLSLVFLYEIGKMLANPSTGWLSAFLFITNPQILLHTRRAMAESMLLFFFIMSLYFLLKLRKPLWLLAVPISLAFNAKQSAMGLIACGIVVIFFRKRSDPRKLLLRDLLLFFLVLGVITVALNPFLWSNPIPAVRYAIDSRKDLVDAQTSTFGLYNTDVVLNNLPKKTVSLFAQIFFGPPQFYETGNYVPQLLPSIKLYQSHWSNNPFPHPLFNILFFLFSAFGLARSAGSILKQENYAENHWVLLMAFIITFLTILFLIPLAFQRYYLPLIPFFCILSGYAISDLAYKTKLRFQISKKP